MAMAGATVPKRCPACRAKIDQGFGLCGGGYGTYWFCEEDMDHFFYKEQDPEEEVARVPVEE